MALIRSQANEHVMSDKHNLLEGRNEKNHTAV